MPTKKKAAARRRAVKKSAAGSSQSDASINEAELPVRTGMPAQDSIISETTFVSPKGNVYRILKTNEMDEYDKPPSPKKKRSPRR